MFCSKCGTQLPDDASFCMKCGKSLLADTTNRPVQWEVCQIYEEFERQSFLTSTALGFLGRQDRDEWYEARVGNEVIAKSSAIRYKRSYAGNTPKSYWQGMTAAKQSLIEELVADGWEPIIKDNGEIDALKRLKS